MYFEKVSKPDKPVTVLGNHELSNTTNGDGKVATDSDKPEKGPVDGKNIEIKIENASWGYKRSITQYVYQRKDVMLQQLATDMVK